MWKGLSRDGRDAVRALRRSPGATAAAVIALALGIGGSSAIFTFIDAVLLRPLRYQDPGRLVAVFTHERSQGEARNPTSPRDFLAWKDEARGLERLTAAQPWAPALTGAGDPERLAALRATHDLFPLLGVEPALGRTFSPADAGDDHLVVLSDRIWRGRFGADRGLLGQTLRLDGAPYTVIGVMPAGFEFPPFWATGVDLWVPRTLSADGDQATNHFLRVFGRRTEGASLERVQGEMDAVATRLEQEHPETNTRVGVNVEPLQEPVVSDVRRVLLVAFGAVGLLLAISLANVANLLLAQGTTRVRELGVRAALGATRGRLVRQLLAESLLLSSLGGAAGLGVGAWGVDLMRRLGPADLPRLAEVGLSGRVFLFTLGLSVLSGVLFGVVPALRAARLDISSALGGVRGVGTESGGRTHRILVASEVAFASLVLVTAALLGGSLARLLQVDPGFDPRGRSSLTVSLAGTPQAEEALQADWLATALERVEALPAVEHAAFVNHLPIGGDTWRSPYRIEGSAPENTPPRASFRVITSGYFQTLGIPIRRGRTFDSRDGRDGLRTVIVSEALARRHWPPGTAVGARIRMSVVGDDWLTIIGVAGDVRQRSLAEEAIPEVYLPYSQNPVPWWTQATLVVDGGTGEIGRAVRSAIGSLDRTLPISDPVPLARMLGVSVARERFQALLLGTFAAVALLLAAVGIYGVVSYSVNRRIREIGVRMALGAGRREIRALVLGHGMLPVCAGIGLGLLGAAAVGRLLGGLLFGIEPTDPATYGAVTVLLAGAALLACVPAARRATRVDPIAALRQD